MTTTPLPSRAVPRVAGAPGRSAPAMDSAGSTRRGGSRTANEDRFRALGNVLAVADGVGAHPGGARAAETAVSAAAYALRRIAERVGRRAETPVPLLQASLARVLPHVQGHVCDEAARRPEWRRMATTLTAALAGEGWLGVVHVGDSRCYRVRDGTLELLTRDHTVGAMLREAGIVTAEDAARPPLSNTLVNAVTTAPGAEDPGADIRIVPLRPGDIVVLCTDGLTDVLDEGTLVRTVEGAATARAASRALLGVAEDCGARDDATAVVARVL